MRCRPILNIFVPRVAGNPYGNARIHPHERAKRAREFRELSCLLASRNLPADPVDGLVIVTVTWCCKTKHRRDPDNVSGYAKPLIDGLVDAGVIPDDSWRHVDEVRLRIRTGATEEGFNVTVKEAI